MPDTERRPGAFRPADLLPWLPAAAMIGGLVLWFGGLGSGAERTREQLVELKASIAGMRQEMAASLAGIRQETATLPRLTADLVNLERRIGAMERGQETQDERIGRLGDAISTMRGDLNQMRGELGAIRDASRVQLPGRVPR